MGIPGGELSTGKMQERCNETAMILMKEIEPSRQSNMKEIDLGKERNRARQEKKCNSFQLPEVFHFITTWQDTDDDAGICLRFIIKVLPTTQIVPHLSVCLPLSLTSPICHPAQLVLLTPHMYGGSFREVQK